MAVGLSACGETASEPDCEFETTFSAIESVFEARGCTASACHGQAPSPTTGMLDLRPGNAYDSLANGEPQASSMARLFPGEEELSLLYQKLAAGTNGQSLPNGISGGPMPASGEALSEDELELVRLWLRAGAPEEGFVADTTALLKCNPLVDATPNKIPPPEPPAIGTGLQFYAGAWALGAEAEDELCFIGYYDYTDRLDLIPAKFRLPCDDQHGGPERECFGYNTVLLSQDPQSHHSITEKYIPPVEKPEQLEPMNPDSGFKNWQCLGGASSGASCDPREAGACGARSQCVTQPETGIACIGYENGPTESGSLLAFFGQAASRVNIATVQEFIFREEFPEGVFSMMPVKGYVMWNSHGFNLTPQDTTIEQWLDVEFAVDRTYKREQIFDATDIFSMGPIEPFEKQQICSSYTVPQYGHLLTLSSHMHKRGTLFEIWYPPNAPCTPGPGCQPPAAAPDYTNRLYNDPLYQRFAGDEPEFYFTDEDEASRTFRFCAVYDNGFTTPSRVRRDSVRANAASCGFLDFVQDNFGGDGGSPIGTPPDRCGCLDEVQACYGGTDQGEPCGGDDSACGGGGVCDACPLKGGVTTEDEMFLMLGSYFVEPPDTCEKADEC